MTRAVFAMAICLLLSGCAPYNQSYWSGYPEYGECDDSFYARLHEELLYRQLSAPRYNNGLKMNAYGPGIHADQCGRAVRVVPVQ